MGGQDYQNVEGKKTPAGGERSERKIKAFCLCSAEKAESEEDHTAWPSAARCNGKDSALRWQGQHAAMAKATRCDGKGSALRWQSQRTGLLRAVRS